MLQKRMVCSLIFAAVFLASFLPRQVSAAETGMQMETVASGKVLSWPGDNRVAVYDTEPFFLRNTSGLDFYDGKLYVVDNGNGRIWVLEVAADGTMTPAKGYESGKRVQYASHVSKKGPDAEGITVCKNGYVYLAAERDNSDPGITSNTILQVNPWGDGSQLPALQEWDLTESLPEAYTNEGLEAVEWVSGMEMTGKITDQNTGMLFDIANYPDAVSGGLFFLVLETNNRIYAYILNQDGSSVQIAELDPELEGAVALDYDSSEAVLWVAADDRGANKTAKLRFLEGKMEIVHILPPDGIDPDSNNEGFAVAEEIFVTEDKRPVYRIQDGVSRGALTIGSMDYHVHAFSVVWLQNEITHWHGCACGEQADSAPHIFGTVVSKAAKKSDLCWNHTAVYYQSCLICGYIDSERFFHDGRALNPEKYTTPVATQIYGIPNL